MIINDIVYAMVEPSFFHVQIWDHAKNEVVFDGMADDIPDEYLELEASIDCPVAKTNGDAYICFNIDTTE